MSDLSKFGFVQTIRAPPPVPEEPKPTRVKCHITKGYPLRVYSPEDDKYYPIVEGSTIWLPENFAAIIIKARMAEMLAIL